MYTLYPLSCPSIATALFLMPPLQSVQIWFSLPTFFLILWQNFDTFQPSRSPFLLLHCLLELQVHCLTAFFAFVNEY